MKVEARLIMPVSFETTQLFGINLRFTSATDSNTSASAASTTTNTTTSTSSTSSSAIVQLPVCAVLGLAPGCKREGYNL